MITLVLVATLLTWVSGLAGPFRHDGGDVAFADGFPGPADRWTRRGPPANTAICADAVALLPALPRAASATTHVPLDASALGEGVLLRVRTSIETRTTSPDPDDVATWVIVRFLDVDGAFVRARVVSRASPLAGVHRAEDIVAVPARTRSIALIFVDRTDAASGEFRLLEASVEAVTPSVAGRSLAYALVALWTATLYVLVRWLGRGAIRFRFALPLAGASVATIFVGVLLPESITTGPLRDVWRAVTNAYPSLEAVTLVHVFKLGHFSAFLVAALLLYSSRRALGLSWSLATLLLSLLAVASEGIQLHLHNRTTSGADLALDAAGIALAAIGVSVIARFRANASRGPGDRAVRPEDGDD